MGKNAQVVCSFFADDDAGLRLVKQKWWGCQPRRINTPTTIRKRLAAPYSPTTYQPQYHQRRKA